MCVPLIEQDNPEKKTGLLEEREKNNWKSKKKRR